MSLEFIYGPATCSAQKILSERTLEWLEQDSKNQVFYLVPNHVKFETEVSVLEQIQRLSEREVAASLQMQVFSFSRLAWYFLQYTPQYQQKTLSEAGTHMLLRQLLKQHQEALHLYRGEINKVGFIQQLADLFQELQSSNVLPDDLAIHLDQYTSEKQKDLEWKLSDIELLYREYLQKLQEQELKSSQLLLELANFLEAKDLSHICFIVDGFSFFTPQELELIHVLVSHAGAFKIHLILDQPYIQEKPRQDALFFDSGNLYYHLYHYARSLKIPILYDSQLQCHHHVVDDLAAIGTYWHDSHTPSVPISKQHLQIWEATTPYAEVNHIAKEIRRLVVEEGYRYQDIQVLSRELPDYLRVIEPVFKEQEIPISLNIEHSMQQHPLLEFIQSLFLIQRRYYRYSDIMRFLRTELFFPKAADFSFDEWQVQRLHYRNQIDLTENVVLAYGFEGAAWTKEEDWVYIEYDFETERFAEDQMKVLQEQSNQVRRSIQQCLPTFFEQLASAEKGTQAAHVFYQFLKDSGVDQQLLFWRDADIASGNLERAKIHEQTWQTLMDVLDDYVFIFGEDEFVLEDFEAILLSGLEDLHYSQIPATIDQVNVAPMDLLHANLKKVTFLVGLTDQVLPSKVENKTLLTDEDRVFLSEILPEEKQLVNNTPQKIAREPYRAYLAFQSAREKLYLTYPMTSERTKQSHLSPYVLRLVRHFGLEVQKKETEVRLDDSIETSFEFIGTYRALVTMVTNVFRQAQEENRAIPTFWLDLEKKLYGQQALRELTQKIMGSLSHKNIPETIAPEKMNELMGQTIFTSVSQIENFYQCQYKYFLTYALKLKERPIFEFSPAAAGDFYHETLDYLFKTLIQENLLLSQMTLQELDQLTERVLQQVLAEKKFYILTISNRMNYIRYQLSKTLKKVSWALQEQSKRTGMTPVQTEILFGQIANQQGLKSLAIPIDGQHQMEVRGKIDRLDTMKVAEDPYIAVVDYKSSRHEFHYRDAYYGLTMQMLTYLDVALQNAVTLVGTKAKPAGAFYLHVKNPLLKEYVTEEEQYQQATLKEFQYQGLLVEEEGLLQRLDPTLSAKEKSLVYPFQLSAKEQYKSTEFVQEQELEQLIDHNRTLFQQAGTEIYAGKACLNPAYRDKQRIACKYCPFRSICQFDVMLPENNYHQLKKMDKKAVLEKIKGGVEDDETTDSHQTRE